MKEFDELLAMCDALMKAWDTDEPDRDESYRRALNEMSEEVFEDKMMPARRVIEAYRRYAYTALVENWNREHDSGVIVDVTLDHGAVVRTVTRSSAYLLSGVTPVIMLQSIRGGHRFGGCYSLGRVRAVPVPSEADEETLEYSRAGGGAVCPICGLELRAHPDALDHPDYRGRPWLVKRCDGSLVKL